MQIPFLLYISVAFIVVRVVRRKEAIGGWLLYFYYWISAVLFISFRDITQHLKVYGLSFRSTSMNHEALVLAVFPRLFMHVAVAAVAVILLMKREWVWVERSEEHTSELQSRGHLVCRLLLEKKKRNGAGPW